MREINYQALREIAKQATQGEWVAFISPGKHGTYAVHTPGDNHHGDIVDWPGFDEQKNAENNARYIAAFNPEVAQELLDERETQNKRIAELEKSEEQLINERDHAESALADMYFAATGNRPEWSNWFGFSDAVDAVVDRIADLEAKQPSPVVPDNASESLAYAYKELTPEIMRGHIAVFERYGIAPNDSIITIQALRIALDGIERSNAMLNGDEPVSQTYKLNELAGNYPVTPDGWISCSERMPPAGVAVLVCMDGIVQKNVYCWDGEAWNDWYKDYDEEPQDAFTHWMPLPEPPQEVSQ
ncbi:TPA: ead/Ea22-like family protein [Escherichia coli]|nr:ead/Ea22-like family protein [Escherichia coli]